MSIITRFLYKIKQYSQGHLEEVGACLIIIFVGISSFGLGRYSVLNQVSEDKIVIENDSKDINTTSNRVSSTNSNIDSVTNQDTNNSAQVVASKTGKRYYLPWCGAAQRISDKNKVYFASALEAEKAGLTKATNCKGM